MLGLKTVPPPYELSTDLKVLPSNTLFAGAGLATDRLVTLFRCCKVNRIDQVYEFQIGRRRLAELPAPGAPVAELRRLLQGAGPLPLTVEDVLGNRPRAGGRVGIRRCSALVWPESAEVLDAIRQHPRLKGYLEAGAPGLLCWSRRGPARRPSCGAVRNSASRSRYFSRGAAQEARWASINSCTVRRSSASPPKVIPRARSFAVSIWCRGPRLRSEIALALPVNSLAIRATCSSLTYRS